MGRLCAFAFVGAMMVFSAGLAGQDGKKEVKKGDDQPTKVKGMLPPNWAKVGLSDVQKQDIYKVQAKYNAEIKKLKDQIEELEATRMKEMRAVLSPEQRKKLDQIVLGKDE